MPKKKVDPVRDDVREMQKRREQYRLDKRREHAGEMKDMPEHEQHRARFRGRLQGW